MCHHNRGQARKDTASQNEHLLTNLRMAAHNLPFSFIKRTTFIKDPLRDASFANIM